MRYASLVLLLLSLVLLLLSCHSVPRPTRDLGYAQALSGGFAGLDFESFGFDDDSEKNSEFDDSSPMVLVEARFLKVEPGLGTRVPGEGPPVSFRKLSEGEAKHFFGEQADEHSVEQLSAPTLTAYSGQRAHTLVVSQRAYIQDFEMRPVKDGDGSLTPHPVIGVLTTGTVVQMRPRSRGEDVEIQEFSAVVVERLGERACRGSVVQKEATFPLVWQEPVVLTGTPDEGLPESLTLKAGEALLVPLRYRVEQATANARAYALPGTVEERYVPIFDESSEATSPMNHECVVLITARHLTAEERRARGSLRTDATGCLPDPSNAGPGPP